LERKASSGVIVTCLLIGMLTLAFNIQQVKSTSSIEYVEGFNTDEPVDARAYYDADWFGLEYTPTVPYNIKKVELIAGGGSGNYVVQLRPDSGGMPSDTILREISFTQADTVSWQGAEFAESYPLTAGTAYWVVFKPVAASQASIAQSGTPITHVWDYGGDGWDGKDNTFPWMAKFYKEVAVIPPVTVAATVDFEPNTLNLRSQGRWITAHIELPEGYNVRDIDVSSILLNDTIPVDSVAPTDIGDYDLDGTGDLMVKFDRASVMALLRVGKVTLTIVGEVNGTPFEGTDTIRVIRP